MLTEFLIKQSQKPSGLIGRVITKIWSFYFKKLSLWAIKQTTISDNYRILEIGYGGGSTIKNLLALNKNLEIHGIDISKESYRTAQRVHSDSIRKGSVQLKIGNVENMPYQNNYFDRIFAIQTHIFWKDIKKSFQEVYRVLSSNSTLIIASEKEKIHYHMTDYRTSHEFSQLLTSIGFSKIEEKQNRNWILFIVYK
ncbi:MULTISPECIES: class I SAM-dependent methyltransferase [Streptococcus]|uniref:class I SAM-dependent methyltransferase n=1 Tax=Streptococcus TaxID=1301 RepID=UPI00066A4F57|nr:MULTISPECIES: class I SAM-dependent methyltransferase [Streptococcus]MBS5356234.1 class I SAM-dependent methyltransferase [Streptococcus parasanguinis]OFP07174.1 methyltransferase [Streptococcus sp. HMSC065E03]